jgi:hypothetical protein
MTHLEKVRLQEQNLLSAKNHLMRMREYHKKTVASMNHTLNELDTLLHEMNSSIKKAKSIAKAIKEGQHEQ